MILAGDVGGTKVNLAYFSADHHPLVPELVKSYPSNGFGSLIDVIDALRRDHPSPITGAAFGIAGPIEQGKAVLTNLNWEVNAEELARHLGIGSVALLNDLEATAYGILHLTKNDIVVLQEGTPRKEKPIAVIAAGTGLGEGGLVWDGTRYVAVATEGGHKDFAPRNELEIELLRFLLQRFDHVSYERLVSGQGLINLYSFFRSRSPSPEPAWLSERLAAGDPAPAISRAALEGADDSCVKALDLFVSLYGAEAGNLALGLLAAGGVYLGGGIGPKILPKMKEGEFLRAFVEKGRLQGLLEKIPVHLILNERTAILGAAHRAVIAND